MKKIIITLLAMFSVIYANAQDDSQLFEKEYKFPLANNNGKCSVTGVMDFTTASFDDDDLFTNLYVWITENIGQDKVLKMSPVNKIISCRYSAEGNSAAITGKKNIYYFSTAFRIADKHVYVTQSELEVLPAISFNKKNVGLEKYAALKKPADKNIIDEFNDVNNEVLEQIMDFVGTNVPEHVNNWDNIVSKRVTEGMTMTETKLALGAPQSVVEGNTETQWIYGLSLIVYFDDGKDIDSKTKKTITREKKVTRILR